MAICSVGATDPPTGLLTVILLEAKRFDRVLDDALQPRCFIGRQVQLVAVRVAQQAVQQAENPAGVVQGDARDWADEVVVGGGEVGGKRGKTAVLAGGLVMVIHKELPMICRYRNTPSLACWPRNDYAKLGDINQVCPEAMQRPDPKSAYYKEFRRFQQKLCNRIKELRDEHGYTQEDMTEFELSLRQYQRMEQDPTSIASLWQVYKLAKAFGLSVDELLDVG